MCKVTDFRIGNYIQDYECEPYIFQVEEIGKYVGYENWIKYRKGSIKTKEPLGVKLSETWLLSFGFTRHHNDYFNSVLIIKNVVDFESENPNEEFEFKVFPKTDLQSAMDIMNSKKIKYVHELQNLYHSITGNELVVS